MMKTLRTLSLILAGILLAGCAPKRIPTAQSPLGGPLVVSPTATAVSYGAEVKAQIAVSGRPYGLASGFNSLWVTGNRAHQLYRIDPASTKGLSSIPVGLGPGAVIATGDSLWVANYGTGAGEQSIARVDPRTDKVVGTFRLPAICCRLVEKDGAIWSIDGKSTLTRIDLKTMKMQTIALPDNGAAEGPFASDEAIWTAGGGQLYQYDLKKNRLDNTFSITGSLLGFWSGLFWSTDGDVVRAMYPETGETILQVEKSAGIKKFIASQNFVTGSFADGILWMTAAGDQGILLVKIDPALIKVTKTILLGPAETQITGILVDGSRVYATDSTHNQVLLVEPGE